MKTPLDVLGEVRIASPCPASWDEMTGDERARHCSACSRTVYDLSRMTAVEAVDLLTANGWDACVRLYRRPDGTVKTSDCPAGSGRGVGWLWRLSALAASWIGWLFLSGCSPCTQGKPTMGPPSPSFKESSKEQGQK
jgi:hypothetical protein